MLKMEQAKSYGNASTLALSDNARRNGLQCIMLKRKFAYV